MIDAHAVALKIKELISKANSIGLAVETAVDAFIEKLWPTFAADDPSAVSAFAACPAEFQADVLDAVNAVKGE